MNSLTKEAISEAIREIKEEGFVILDPDFVQRFFLTNEGKTFSGWINVGLGWSFDERLTGNCWDQGYYAVRYDSELNEPENVVYVHPSLKEERKTMDNRNLEAEILNELLSDGCIEVQDIKGVCDELGIQLRLQFSRELQFTT